MGSSLATWAAPILLSAFGWLQDPLDVWMTLPPWVGFAALALAALLVALGKRGQRPLNGAVLSSIAAGLSLRGLAPYVESQSPLPGISAMATGAAAALFGIFSVEWGTSVLCALFAGVAGGSVASALGLKAIAGILPLGGLGLYLGMMHRQRLALALPPVGAALFTVLGACRLLGPHDVGARIPQLNDAPWAAGLGLFSLALYTPAAIVREVRERRRKRAEQTQELTDQRLKEKLARERERRAKSPEGGETVH